MNALTLIVGNIGEIKSQPLCLQRFGFRNIKMTAVRYYTQEQNTKITDYDDSSLRAGLCLNGAVNQRLWEGRFETGKNIVRRLKQKHWMDFYH